jgi:YesN/AraC family two-component response regulator
MTDKVRVLVVDDKETTCDGLKAILEGSRDIEVISQASNGLEALKLVEESQPDVVLMDVRMPVMDGIEATRRIKESWPDIKVIILSMYSTYKEQSINAGADHFLVKGVKTGSLTDDIKEVGITG